MQGVFNDTNENKDVKDIITGLQSIEQDLIYMINRGTLQEDIVGSIVDNVGVKKGNARIFLARFQRKISPKGV